MIKKKIQISEHFHSSEFKCPCCSDIKISEKLVENLEILFKKLNASKCIISSGYRCESEEYRVAGFVAQHNKGYASDCIYYGKDGTIIPSKIVICVAWDLDIFTGIARINENFVHLDVRTQGTYHGDELKGNSSYWNDPYKYFNVTKQDIMKYVNVETNTEFTKGDYVTNFNMYVRTGPSTYYGVKLVKYMTKDGKKNALSQDENSLAIYKKGTFFTALDVITNNYGVWARTPSGYVCIKGASGTVYSSKV